MSDVATSSGNGLSDHSFSFVPELDDDQVGGGVAERSSDRFTTAGATGREVETTSPRSLSAAQYLAWLSIETREALRISEECRAGGRPPMSEDGEEPPVRPLPVDLPPLERRLLELQMRLARENLDTARRIARADYARRDAFDAGLKIDGQGT